MVKQLVATVLITAALTCALTRYYWPTTRIEQQTNEVVRRDVVTVVREVTRPDGSKETSTITTDKSKEAKTTQQSAKAPSNWLVGVSAAKLSEAPLYSLQISRRILGPIWFGASVNSEKTFGVIATLEF